MNTKILGIMVLASLAEAYMCMANHKEPWVNPPPVCANKIYNCFPCETINCNVADFTKSIFPLIRQTYVTHTPDDNKSANGRIHSRELWNKLIAQENNLIEKMALALSEEIDREVIAKGLCDQATRKKEEQEQGMPPEDSAKKTKCTNLGNGYECGSECQDCWQWCHECGIAKGKNNYCENATCELSPAFRLDTVGNVRIDSVGPLKFDTPMASTGICMDEVPLDLPVKVGDVVWSAITGMGPYVVVNSTFHEITKVNGKSASEAAVTINHPDTFEKSLKIDDRTVEAWMVKDRYGRYFTIPMGEVSKIQPSRSILMIAFAWMMYIMNIRKIWQAGI